MSAIEKLIEKYRNAVFQKDIKAYASVFDDQVRVFDMWEKWTYEGLSEWTDMAETWFASLNKDRDQVTFHDLQIQETGEMAVATAIVRFTAISEQGEELRYLENRLTWVARKKGEEWKIFHQHSSGPVDFSTMKVILKR